MGRGGGTRASSIAEFGYRNLQKIISYDIC
jgi:hypothetical protein